MKNHKIYTTSFASVYPHYVSKVKRKGQSKTDLNRIICWLTGYSQTQLNNQIKKGTNFETFFKDAPKMHPSRRLIKGVVCGIRIENIKENFTLYFLKSNVLALIALLENGSMYKSEYLELLVLIVPHIVQSRDQSLFDRQIQDYPELPQGGPAHDYSLL